jgi:hypothetical protein
MIQTRMYRAKYGMWNIKTKYEVHIQNMEDRSRILEVYMLNMERIDAQYEV